MNGNRKKYYITSAFTSVVMLFTQGSIVNSFLVYLGLTDAEVSLYATLSSVVQGVVMAILFLFADKIKAVVRNVGIASFFLTLFHVLMTVSAIFRDTGKTTLLITVISAAVILNFILGIKVILDYKLYYYILDLKDYAQNSGIVGIISNILLVSVSFLFTLATTVIPYITVAVVCFIMSAILCILTGFITLSFKIISDAPNDISSSVKLFDVLKNKATLLFFFPNIIRGIGSGIFALSAVVMLSTVTENASLSSFLSTVLAVASIISCFIFSAIVRKVSEEKIILIGALIFLPSACLMTLFGEVGFIVFYFLAAIGMTLVDYGIPTYVFKIVPCEIMARYSSIRMFTHNLGIAIGSALAGALLAVGAATLLFIITGVIIAAVGVFYFAFSHIFKPCL